MAHFKKDRVRDTTTTIGTNPLVLLGVVPTAYQGFSSMSIGDTCFYACVHQSAGEWETGLATMSSAATLTRTTVLESSNANAAVNFSVGTKDVWIDLPAQKRALFDQEGVTLIAGTTAIAPLKMVSGANLTTAVAGSWEYNGIAPMFTPLGTQRGIVPAAQYHRTDSAVAGANATGVQAFFGKSATLSASTIYEFEFVARLAKTVGATSHTISLAFGGSATYNNFSYHYHCHPVATAATNVIGATSHNTGFLATSGSTVVTVAIAAASSNFWCRIIGTASVNAGGLFTPQYALSAAPGGAYSTQIGSFFKIAPLAASGADINVGNLV